MTVRYYERKIGDRIFHYARTCETKNEAEFAAKRFRQQGYLARIVPVKFYFDQQFQVFTFPKETNLNKVRG